MQGLPRYPSLYQINTRVWLTELARARGRRATLDDIADVELDRLAGTGFDWVWLLSVWSTGPAGRSVSRTQARVRTDVAGPAGGGHRGFRVRLRDLLGVASLDRGGSELESRGLYLDLPPWGCHAFALSNA
jgi:hypothetical protein